MIFVDTGPFLARWIERDQHHQSSLRAWKEIESRGQRCATSSFVIDETLTLLARRVNYSFAADRGRSLYASTHLTILRPDRDDEIVALQSFSKLADQEVSFTDCVSFALMRRHRVRRAFTFDGHFRAGGVEVWPKL